MSTRPRLLDQYRNELLPELSKQFGYKSTMAAPRLKKIIVNIGVGEAKENVKILDQAADELGLIAGQKPAITRARKSVANFKIREGMPIGCKVTLRRARMYEFLDRLVSIALPRVRDFRGISDKAFDGRGNYTLGITDQLIFPEVASGKIDKIMGMNITIVTSAQTDAESRALLQGLGMPFQRT